MNVYTKFRIDNLKFLSYKIALRCSHHNAEHKLRYEHGSVTSRLFRILIDQTTNQPTDEHEGS